MLRKIAEQGLTSGEDGNNKSPCQDSMSKSPSSFNCKTIITGEKPYRFLKHSNLDRELLYQNIFRSRSQIKSNLPGDTDQYYSPISNQGTDNYDTPYLLD